MRWWILLVLCACANPRPPVASAAAVSDDVAAAAPRGVVLIIGDGMGPQQVGLLELYARRAPEGHFDRPTAFTRMASGGVMGLSLHDPMDRLVADSACSASQLALGLAAPSESIGVDATGEPRPTVLEVARDLGRSTGLVSDTRITHATPAAFAAHVAHRSQEHDIAVQMLQARVDVLLSGGWRYFLPREQGGSRDDGQDLLMQASQDGVSVVRDLKGLEQIPVDGRLLGLFAPSGMLDAITEHQTRGAAERTQPSLAQMAIVALDRLARDPDGFFLMVESGQVDWAGHANDAGWLMHEMIRAEETVTAVLDWAQDHPDVLVVVTADHETGGFGLSYQRYDVPEPRELPGAAFADRPYAPRANFGQRAALDGLFAQRATWQQVVGELQGLPEAEQTAQALAERVSAVSAFPLDEAGAARVLAMHDDPWSPGTSVPDVHDFSSFYYGDRGDRSPLIARELAAAQGVVWATGTHTHTPVPVFAVGPGAERFTGLHHHTELGVLLREAVQGR